MHFDFVTSFLVMHAEHSQLAAFCLATIDLNTLSVAGRVTDGWDGVDDVENEPNENVFCGVASLAVVPAAPAALPFDSPQHTHLFAVTSFGTIHVLQSHFELLPATSVAESNGANGFGAAAFVDGLSLPQQAHLFADLSLDMRHAEHSHLSCFCLTLIDLNSVLSLFSSVDACDKRIAEPLSSLLSSVPVDLLPAEPNDCDVSAMPLSDVTVRTVFGSNRRLVRLVCDGILSSTNMGLLKMYGFVGTVTLYRSI